MKITWDKFLWYICALTNICFLRQVFIPRLLSQRRIGTVVESFQSEGVFLVFDRNAACGMALS